MLIYNLMRQKVKGDRNSNMPVSGVRSVCMLLPSALIICGFCICNPFLAKVSLPTPCAALALVPGRMCRGATFLSHVTPVPA